MGEVGDILRMLVWGAVGMEGKDGDFYLGEFVLAQPELFEAFEIFEVLYLLLWNQYSRNISKVW